MVPKDTPMWAYLGSVQGGDREVIGMANLRDITPRRTLEPHRSRRRERSTTRRPQTLVEKPVTVVLSRGKARGNPF
jgi:hypothetical protein